MEYVVKDIPLWQITTWDKNFNNVDKSWQPRTIKYNYLLSDELDAIKVENGDVRILYTGKDIGYTTEALAGDNLSEGEIVSIPWGGIPTVKYYKGKFVTGDNRIATSNDTSILTNKYLYYYMQGKIKEIASYYRGASLKHPCMKDVLKMTISFPVVAEQERICALLDVLDGIINRRKTELDCFDELIKARFVELFGDIKTNEFGWDKCTFKDVSIKITDGEHGTVPRVDEGDGYLYFMARNITKDGEIDLSETSYVPCEVHNKIYKRCNPEKDDLLLVCVGATIGKCALVPDSLGEFSMARSVALIKPNKEMITSNFLINLLRSEAIQNDIDHCSHAAAQAGLYTNMINSLEAFVPPKELQEEFDAFCKQVDKSKVAVQKSLDETQKLFDSLMQEYFG